MYRVRNLLVLLLVSVVVLLFLARVHNYIKNKGCAHAGTPFVNIEWMMISYISSTAACAAARRAIGTRNGEQET